MVVLWASNPPWRRMGHRGALHPATVPFFKRTVKARGKLFCKRERHTHIQKNPSELRRRLLGTQRSCSDYSDSVCPGHVGTPTATQSFHVESCVCLTVGKVVSRETTSQTVTKRPPPYFDKSEWEDSSWCTLFGLLNTWSLQLHRYKPTQGYILEMAFLTTASAAPQKGILERGKFLTWFPSFTV